MSPLATIVDAIAGRRVLVVGDFMLDRYLKGGVTRVSPEAPVPVVHLSKRWSSPGGAGHVAACLAGLGVNVTAVGVAGQDAAAQELSETMERAGVAHVHLLRARNWQTVTKTRVLAGDSHQLLRIDEESQHAEAELEAEPLMELAEAHLAACDVVVLSDYDKGTLSPRVLDALIARARRAGKPVVIDPKKTDFAAYRGASVITPNTLETERALGRPLRGDADARAVAIELRERYELDAVLITRGAHGMTGADADGAFEIPARVREVADVTGAGDTVVAALAATFAAGGGLREGCALAGLAAGIAVSHPGTYVVKLDELRAVAGGKSSKIVGWDAAASAIREAQAAGKKVAFTNGCFDILHAGHLRSLNDSRSLGDMLVVGLNSDASVKALKGPTRPINSQADRAALLAGLSCVDRVVIFDEERPEQLIRHLAPDILVKGADYRPEIIAGAEFVISRGGRVVILPLVPGLSTTGILDRNRGGGDSPAEQT